MALDLEDRFWNYVDLRGPDECWGWLGSFDRGGYGRFDSKGAHRVSHSLNVGAIPDGMCVLHRCDNPACVNPKHLFLGTCKDNVVDMVSKGRNAKTTGEDNFGAKLTNQQVLAIREDGRTNATIAAEYMAGVVAIRNIKTRRKWKSLIS